MATNFEIVRSIMNKILRAGDGTHNTTCPLCVSFRGKLSRSMVNTLADVWDNAKGSGRTRKANVIRLLNELMKKEQKNG